MLLKTQNVFIVVGSQFLGNCEPAKPPTNVPALASVHGAGRVKARPLRSQPVRCKASISISQHCCGNRSRPFACFPALSLAAQFRADIPAPPAGLSALTLPPKPEAGRLQPSRSGPRRASPRPAGARRHGRGTCPLLAARAPGLRSAPGPGRARAGLYEWRDGPSVPGRSRAGPALQTGGRTQGPVRFVL